MPAASGPPDRLRVTSAAFQAGRQTVSGSTVEGPRRSWECFAAEDSDPDFHAISGGGAGMKRYSHREEFRVGIFTCVIYPKRFLDTRINFDEFQKHGPTWRMSGCSGSGNVRGPRSVFDRCHIVGEETVDGVPGRLEAGSAGSKAPLKRLLQRLSAAPRLKIARRKPSVIEKSWCERGESNPHGR